MKEARVRPFSRAALTRPTLVALLGLIWFSSAFFGGYLLGQVDAMNGRRRAVDLALQAAAMVGLHPRSTVGAADAALGPTDREQFRIFWEAWSLVSREFYNRAAIDPQKLTYGAVKGMVESLGDPYTAFSTPRDKELTDSSLRGTFDGVGVQIDRRDGELRVVAPIEGSPAEKAGLRAGDVIVRVDDREIKDLELNEIVALIRGPRGTTVRLTVTRAGKAGPIEFSMARAEIVRVDDREIKDLELNEIVALIRGPRGTTVRLTVTRAGKAGPIEFSMARAEIKLENVRSRMIGDDVGYVRIATFSATSGADTTAALGRLLASSPQGIVLDLRANPGGYLTAAVDVSSQFLNDGVVLYQEAAGGERQEYRSKIGGQATGLPIAVLIDRGSASASEIVAAALQENGRAVLVGEKSYGKGSVQTVHTLSDSSGLRVTSAIWLTPNGRPLDHQGLDPDLAIATPQDGAGGPDPQLDAAVRYLRGAATASSGEPKLRAPNG
jgi:carboxyl-terminal processing protease